MVELETESLVDVSSNASSCMWSSCSSSEELERLPEADLLAEFDLTAEVIIVIF